MIKEYDCVRLNNGSYAPMITLCDHLKNALPNKDPLGYLNKIYSEIEEVKSMISQSIDRLKMLL